MRAIYRISPVLNDFQSLTADSRGRSLLGPVRGVPGTSNGRDLDTDSVVRLQDNYGDDRVRVVGDFLNFVPGVLVLSSAAARILAPFLEPAGELLDFDAELPVIGWNCTSIVDAVDQVRTKAVRYPTSSWLHARPTLRVAS